MVVRGWHFRIYKKIQNSKFLANLATTTNFIKLSDTVWLSRPSYQHKMDKEFQLLRCGTNSCNFAIFESGGMSNMRFVCGGRHGQKFKGDPLA